MNQIGTHDKLIEDVHTIDIKMAVLLFHSSAYLENI